MACVWLGVIGENNNVLSCKQYTPTSWDIITSLESLLRNDENKFSCVRMKPDFHLGVLRCSDKAKLAMVCRGNCNIVSYQVLLDKLSEILTYVFGEKSCDIDAMCSLQYALDVLVENGCPQVTDRSLVKAILDSELENTSLLTETEVSVMQRNLRAKSSRKKDVYLDVDETAYYKYDRARLVRASANGVLSARGDYMCKEPDELALCQVRWWLQATGTTKLALRHRDTATVIEEMDELTFFLQPEKTECLRYTVELAGVSAPVEVHVMGEPSHSMPAGSVGNDFKVEVQMRSTLPKNVNLQDVKVTVTFRSALLETKTVQGNKQAVSWPQPNQLQLNVSKLHGQQVWRFQILTAENLRNLNDLCGRGTFEGSLENHSTFAIKSVNMQEENVASKANLVRWIRSHTRVEGEFSF